MRTSLALLATLCLAFTAACGDDDGDDDDTPTIDASADTPDAPVGQPDAAPDSPDAAPGGPDATPNTPPEITMVAWTTPGNCTNGMNSVFTVVVTATDAETPGMLTFSGTVPGCQGQITAQTSMLTCPNVAPYNGNVTVKDPQNAMDVQAITIAPCANGSVP